MHTKIASALCVIVAGALMAIVASTAFAGRLSVSSQTFRATFSELIESTGELSNTCHVTLEGSFHSRTIRKVEGTLIGYITRVTTGQCTLGTTILTETLPWHISYLGFSGTLPEITLMLVRFRMNVRRASCLMAADILARFIRNTSTREIAHLEIPFENNREIPLTGILCPSPRIATLSSGTARGSVMVLGASTKITVTLI